jgi:hypothetical protein
MFLSVEIAILAAGRSRNVAESCASGIRTRRIQPASIYGLGVGEGFVGLDGFAVPVVSLDPVFLFLFLFFDFFDRWAVPLVEPFGLLPCIVSPLWPDVPLWPVVLRSRLPLWPVGGF